MSVKLQIHDQEFLKMVQEATRSGLIRAGVFYHSQAKLALNVPNTGVSVSAKSVQRQAKKQLGGRSKGLIRVTSKRRKSGVVLEAWYQFDSETFRPRIDKEGNVREVKSVTIYPYPSQPGEPPRKRTGWLHRHVVWEYDKNIPAVRVGIGRNALYGLYLELGTRRVKARPWLVATLMKHKAMIGRLLAAQS